MGNSITYLKLGMVAFSFIAFSLSILLSLWILLSGIVGLIRKKIGRKKVLGMIIAESYLLLIIGSYLWYFLPITTKITPGERLPIAEDLGPKEAKRIVDLLNQSFEEEKILKLPSSLISFLKEYYPGFGPPSIERFDQEMVYYFRRIVGEDYLPWLCEGDFDGNGLSDVALILDGKGKTRLVSFHQTSHGDYKSYVLNDVSHPYYMYGGIFLMPAKAGETITYYEYLESKGELSEGKSLYLKNDAFHFGHFEKASELLYWDGKEYQSVITGD